MPAIVQAFTNRNKINMIVKYGDQLTTTINDNDTNPAEIFNILKETFPELSNGTYEVTGEGDDKTFTAFIKSGDKGYS